MTQPKPSETKGMSNFWMPLYIGDYMAATQGLSTEQHGAYFLLICAYWDNGGPLPDDHEELARICRMMPDAFRSHCKRIAKFFRVADGLWHHDRIDTELAKAKSNKEKRTNSSRTAAYARWGKENTDASRNAVAYPDAMRSQCPSPSPSPIAEREYAERPSLQEIQDEAQRIGLAPWKAEDWFHEMEGGGWLDHNHRPIGRWKSVLVRVKTKWEADGRPSGPPVGRSAPAAQPQPKGIIDKEIERLSR